MSAAVWLRATRPESLVLAAASILAGAAWGWHDSPRPIAVTAWALLTAALLQVLANLANDTGDFEHGVDTDARLGSRSALQDGVLTLAQMRTALWVCGIAAALSGIVLLRVAGLAGRTPLQLLVAALAGVGAIHAAVRYTLGEQPYGYRALGDPAVFLFFGIVGVCGTAYLMGGVRDASVLWPAAAVGCFCVGVLNLNNMRDRVNDAACGKITLALRLGTAGSRRYQALLVLTGVVCALMALRQLPAAPGGMALLATLPPAGQMLLLAMVWREREPAALDPALAMLAALTFAWSLLLFLRAVG